MNSVRTLKLPSNLHSCFATEIEILDDGGLQLVELNPIDPWLADPREPLELQEGEVKVRVFCSSHSVCVFCCCRNNVTSATIKIANFSLR